MVINSGSSVKGDTLKLYSFAGRLHALAIVQHMSFNLSFLPTIYSTLYEYDTRGGTHTTSGYARSVRNPSCYAPGLILANSDAKSLRKEAFMDAFIELVPPSVLRVFTLSELHVILAAGREWVGWTIGILIVCSLPISDYHRGCIRSTSRRATQGGGRCHTLPHQRTAARRDHGEINGVQDRNKPLRCRIDIAPCGRRSSAGPETEPP